MNANLENPNPYHEEYAKENLEKEDTETEEIDSKDLIEKMEAGVRAGMVVKVLLSPDPKRPADIAVFYINMSRGRKNNIFLQPNSRNGTQVEE